MLNPETLEVAHDQFRALDKLHEGGRKALISVTLKPGTEIKPVWPFESFVAAEQGSRLAEYPNESRDVLAALITAPQNERFAQVIANRLWQRLMCRDWSSRLTIGKRGSHRTLNCYAGSVANWSGTSTI